METIRAVSDTLPATRISELRAALLRLSERKTWRGPIERLTGDEPSQMRLRLPYPGGELGRQ